MELRRRHNLGSDIFRRGTPEIAVSRVGNIVNDGTDEIGDRDINVEFSLTYTIANNGNIDLTVSAAISNQNNCSAVISVAPSSPVAPAGNTTFQIDITPTTVGAFNFDVTINNNSQQNPFTFTVNGNGISNPPAGASVIYDRAHLTFGTGSDINEVDDQSGQGFDAIYVTGGVGKAQLSSAATLNSETTIKPQNNEFNEGSLYRTAAGNTWADVMKSGQVTIAGVFYVQSVLALFGAPDHLFFSSTNPFFPKIEIVGGPLVRFGWRAVSGDVIVTRSIALGTWYVVTARANGTTVRLQVDNGTEASSAGNNNAADDGQLQLFFSSDDAGCFNGSMAYAIAYDGALSDADVISLKNYLKSRWPALNV